MKGCEQLNKKPPSISDVAQAAGTSVSTVSRYLNKGYVSVDLESRIRTAIDKLNYVPSRFARALKESKNKEIALIVPDIFNPFFTMIYDATQKYCEKNAYSVILHNAGMDEKGELDRLKMCQKMQAAGLIFCSENPGAIVMEQIKKLSIPVVLTNLQEPLLFDTIYSENGQGVYAATKYICGLGHKRIAYSGGPEESVVNKQRKEDFLRAANEAGLAVTKDYIFEMAYSMDSGYKSGLYFFSLAEPPTAIIAANDIIAMGVIMASYEIGKRIPEDFSLTGVDNIDFTKICRPALTTVDNEPVGFAQKACDFLFNRLIEGYEGEPRVSARPSNLIVRDSTAPPKHK